MKSGSITPTASANPATMIEIRSAKNTTKMRTMRDMTGSCNALCDAQSVIAMARNARRSRADSFSVSLLSWPQAARMSRPRGVRTGEA